ncbi:glycerol-3-phosphate dehydrogenase, mitochondrial [Cimex lectularius]|uniref:Glycerol-3-phosphate dehydrogenase n=1 Tax=Cimex lectularius TaxID=79782 RepID=A0A8I6RY15_CIMLE|nr:glycerol-3-phosphate dehydrogenase, mitochondrial [Cimex lectularius]
MYKKLAGGLVLTACGSYLAVSALENNKNNKVDPSASAVTVNKCKRPIPTRDHQIRSLREETFDILVIGGGATGAGCALDAVTRGLKTALVEYDDFSSGTSSRSTKLIHGGVRYLQKAVFNLDHNQYNMVKEALQERANMLNLAPHLTHAIPIMLPLYRWWQIPYYWSGIKLYDFVAGTKSVKSSYYLNKSDSLEHFPMLKSKNLCGSIVYYDGQQDDARMNLAVAITATRYGATIANHVSVQSLLKDNNGYCCGAVLKNELTGEKWECKAKCIINATGPFTDSIRKMDDPSVTNICSPSSGVHVVLPGYYSPDQMGLLDPCTSDGRVIFFLPWLNHTIVGTTDMPCKVSHDPAPSEEEIAFVLKEIKSYINPDVEMRRGDVMSAWSGIRPLVSDPNKKDTQSLARNHIIHVSPSKMVTVAGGKWTTYRAMASDTIDAAIKAVPSLKPTVPNSVTLHVTIEGGDAWNPIMYIRLVQDFGLESEVAKHLANAYGDKAFAVAKLASLTGKRWPIIGNKLHPEFPFIDAEVRYGIKEYAVTAVDMIARRIRLAFLNVQAAQESLPIIIDIMAKELQWSEGEIKRQFDQASEFLKVQMGGQVNRISREPAPQNLSLTDEEIKIYTNRFQMIDSDNKGYVSINDIRRSIKSFGVKISGEQLHEILKEIDTNKNGQVELDEYLMMMSAIKTGKVVHSRFALVAEKHEEISTNMQSEITVDRSCGGV